MKMIYKLGISISLSPGNNTVDKMKEIRLSSITKTSIHTALTENGLLHNMNSCGPTSEHYRVGVLNRFTNQTFALLV